MRRERLIPLLIAVGFVGLFGVRAILGWVGGPAYSKGRAWAAWGWYEDALPLLERGTLGLTAAETLWLRGQVRVGLWQTAMSAGADPREVEHYLYDAHRDYTRAVAMSPASGWNWAGLGELYHQVEWLERRTAEVSLSALGSDPRQRVGRPGRVAVGMSRIAIEREPEVYYFHDQLALTLWDYRLTDAALEAVRRSAAVQPIYRFHNYESLAPAPEEIVDAFAAGSRAALGSTPFLRRTLHLLALGRVEYRRGELEQAERDLRAALEAPGEALNRAEGRYYLGLVLAGLERYDEAWDELLQAETHPNFETLAIVARARIAEARGQAQEAIALLQRARRLEPRSMRYVLEYARVSREAAQWKKAEAALRWGTILEPDNPRPWRGLAATYLQMARPLDAARAVDELERIEGNSASVRQLRDAVERSGVPPSR
jgi:tetratricopeptide (TPR) repeat protein